MTMLQRTLLAAVLGVMLPLSLTAAPAANEVKLEDYRIGYDALLANGAVEDAYQLARDVTRRFPEEKEWKRRLARVAVWTNRPLEAYNIWKELFTAGVRDKEVVGEVRRLATHYNDAPILIELWHETESSRAIKKEDAQYLANLYERAYKPVEGARYLEQVHKKRHQTAFGVQAAQLYARAGRDADAVRVYRALLAKSPANQEWLLAAARLEIRRDRRNAALELLKRHQRYIPDNAFEFWQMMGDLAWLLQDDDAATAAYGHASITSSASLVERDRLTYLLMDKDPMRAASMSLRYFRDGAGVSWLLRALEIQVAQNAWSEARESLVHVQGEELRTLEKDAHFMMLRAHISQHFGDEANAVTDMHQALALAPADNNVRLSALWLFIAANERTALEAMITETDPETGDPRYWQALAAAHQILGHYSEALAYTRRQLEQKPNDALLLFNYADLLDTSGQTEMSAHMRQRSWEAFQKAPVSTNHERYVARVRTELAEQPGDVTALRLRRLQETNRGHSAERRLDELLLVWALENGQLESARAWSRMRYGNMRSLPLWPQLQLALQTYDYETLQHLLGSEGENLPASGAHEAAMLTGDWPAAWQLAFNGAQYGPESDDLHQRLTSTIEAHGDYIGITGQQATYSDLDSTRFQFRVDKAMSNRWRLAVEGYYADQSLTTLTTLRTIPLQDRGVTLKARWSDPQQEWRFALGRHKELTDYTSWQLGFANKANQAFKLDMLVAGRQPTDQSTALQVAGYADRARINAGWAIDRHWSIAAQFVGERYSTQYEAELGSGTMLTWEATYSLRSDYPDWNLHAYGTYSRFNAEGQPDNLTLDLFTAQTRADTPASALVGLFVPKDNNYYGLCGGAGQSLLSRYSHNLHPLAEACAIHNDESGNGYSLLAGMAGSLTGPDQLALVWERSHAGRQAAGRDVIIVTLNYQHYF